MEAECAHEVVSDALQLQGCGSRRADVQVAVELAAVAVQDGRTHLFGHPECEFRLAHRCRAQQDVERHVRLLIVR